MKTQKRITYTYTKLQEIQQRTIFIRCNRYSYLEQNEIRNTKYTRACDKLEKI